jgi:L-ascorbate metabolism protein UlaG (beta-lactamase superfamily)
LTVKSLKPGEKTTFGPIAVEAVEAYNYKRFRSPGTPFHPKGIGVGYLMKAEGKTVYHAGDTDFIDEMKKLKGVDLALMPSGGTYTMDAPEAAEATITLNPKQAVPMHTWDTDPAEYKRRVEAGCDTKVRIMKPGDTLTL